MQTTIVQTAFGELAGLDSNLCVFSSPSPLQDPQEEKVPGDEEAGGYNMTAVHRTFFERRRRFGEVR